MEQETKRLVSICKLDKFPDYLIVSHYVFEDTGHKIVGRISKLHDGWRLKMRSEVGVDLDMFKIATLQEARKHARNFYNDFEYKH